jgi:hypothetical protein
MMQGKPRRESLHVCRIFGCGDHKLQLQQLVEVSEGTRDSSRVPPGSLKNKTKRAMDDDGYCYKIRHPIPSKQAFFSQLLNLESTHRSVFWFALRPLAA